MKLDLPPEIYSKQDLEALIIEVRTFADYTRSESVKKRFHSNTTKDELELSSPTKEFLHDYSLVRPLDGNNLDELIMSLTKTLKTSPSLTITLASLAPLKLKKELITWCRKNISAELFVEFEYSQSILGGLIIRFGSQIKDLSFKRLLSDSQTKLAEVISSVR